MTSIDHVSISTSTRELKEPFITALRTVTTFELFECEVKTSDGRVGRGETVATPAITGHTKSQILSDLNGTLSRFVQGRSFSSYSEIAPDLALLDATSSAKAAVDMALYNLEYPRDLASLKVGSDVTVPIAGYEDLDSIIHARLTAGFNVFKVKLDLESVESSIAKLVKIQDLIGARGRLRVDPNQSWSIEHALAFLQAASAQKLIIDFLEQPTPASDKASLAAIRAQSEIKIMADESCFDLQDLHALLSLDAVDMINIKLLKSGGIYSGLEMAKTAESAGVEVFIGSMMEGDVGVAHAARLAYEISPLATHDLDAAWWAKDSALIYSEGMVAI